MRAMRGRGSYRNKYLQGVLPWQRSLRDVNLCTGNLFKSFTDVQVSPAKGAGLALQRTYNSDDDRFGPFGIGWTHAYDIRNQDEQSGAITDESVNKSDRDDFFGGQHAYHRDADGLYTPPAYLFDELSSDYDTFLVNGPLKALDDTEIGMDGTTKHYVAGVSPESATTERVCDYIQDRYGNRTTLAYNDVSWPDGTTHKLLASVTDPSSRQLAFSWTNFGTQQAPAWRITSVQGPQYAVNYAYYTDPNDAASYLNLQSVTLDPGGLNRVTTFTYTSYSDANGTENGLLASVTDPLNHTVSYGYGYQITNPYNANDPGPYPSPTGSLWVTGVSEPAGVDANQVPRTQVWTIAPDYGFNGLLVDFGSTGGIEGELSTDAMLRKVDLGPRFSNGMGPAAIGGVYESVYDTANNVVEQSMYSYLLPNLGTCYDDFTYGPHGNQLTHTNPAFPGTETTTWYNASQYFQKASVTDMNGHTTTFGVGADDDSNVGNRGSVLWVRDAGYNTPGSPSYHKQFTYAYNSYGQKTSEVNLNGVETDYTYGDAWGNLTQVVQDPGAGHLNRTTSMTYDAAGHVLTSTDPNGNASTFGYNTLGQPTSAAFPATAATPAETVTYAYADNGRMESVSDGRGTTTLSYEAGSDRVSSVADPVTGSVSYTYGVSGERASMSLPGGGTWNYSYLAPGNCTLSKDDPQAINRSMSGMVDDQGRIVEYELDDFGHMPSAKWNEVYDGGGNLVSYCETDYYTDNRTGKLANDSHFWLASIVNSYHGPNQIGQQVSYVLTENDYDFDNTGQKLDNTISDQNGVVRTESYGYDPLNRLTSVNYGDGQTQTYSFDAMGNRTQKVDSSSGTEGYTYNAANMLLTRGANAYTNDADGNTLTGGNRTNVWDSQNRLAACTYNGTTSTFTYAADGLRHRMVSGAATTDYVLDASMFVRELRNGLDYATYLVGPRGPEYRRDDSTGQIRWYCYDGLGSVLGEVDPTGTLTASRSYDVYGSVRTSAGVSTSKHKFVGSLGHPSEDETGLIYMQARYMDPATGRFESEDKEAAGMNWYAYCTDNPVNLVDLDGAKPLAPWRQWTLLTGVMLAMGAFAIIPLNAIDPNPYASVTAAAMAGFAGLIFSVAVAGLTNTEQSLLGESLNFIELISATVAAFSAIKGKAAGLPFSQLAMGAMFVHMIILVSVLESIDVDGGEPGG